MKTADYIKYYLVKDLILAAVLMISGYAWYTLLIADEAATEDLSQSNVAELVPLNTANGT